MVEQCVAISCKKIIVNDGERRCSCYINPAYWWSRGRCPIPIIPKEAEKELKLNPLKASKIKMKGNLNLGYKFRSYKRGSHKRGKYIEGAQT